MYGYLLVIFEKKNSMVTCSKMGKRVLPIFEVKVKGSSSICKPDLILIIAVLSPPLSTMLPQKVSEGIAIYPSPTRLLGIKEAYVVVQC